MSCYSPIRGYRSATVNKLTGKRKIEFSPLKGYKDLPMEVPCGKCIGCKIDRAKEWSIRCIKEASLHRENCFLTLTYAPEKMPLNGSLDPRQFTLFMKRLRNLAPVKIRFFQCGEYGARLERPHHHCIIFGWMPEDIQLWKRNGPIKIYTSETVSEAWGNGFITVGHLNYSTVYYTAKYLLKKVMGEDAENHYQGRHPEYITMSRMPGIGSKWIEKYHQDVYSTDNLVYGLGQITKPPRYFDEQYKKMNPEHFEKIYHERLKREANSDYNSEYRLKVRKKIQEIKIKNSVRELHQ